MSGEHVRASNLGAQTKKLVSLGRLRGAPTLNGGYSLEIVGGGEVRRTELSPRETVIVAIGMLRSQGVGVEIDPSKFPHFHG